jgi:hypothetical protein
LLVKLNGGGFDPGSVTVPVADTVIPKGGSRKARSGDSKPYWRRTLATGWSR